MEDAPPIQITVWTKNMMRRGTVEAPNRVEVTVRDGAAGDALFEVDADHDRIADLTAPGARVVIDYYPDDDTDPVTLSGNIDELTGAGPADSAVRAFSVTDDWEAVFVDLQAWPNPTGTIAQQGDDTAYFTRTGPAETVLKQVVQPNAQRQGLGLVVPATQGRGATVTASLRFHPLTDKLLPAIARAGLGVRVVQRDAQLVLECWTPTIHTRVLDEESEVIVDGQYQRTSPTVTRVVVGAGGEGTARVFRHYIDTALEAEWGPRNRRERFIDARDIPATDPQLETLCAARAEEALAEGAPRAGITAKLAETEAWRFGKTFALGDTVPLQMSGGPVLTDRVREVQILWDDQGLVVTPFVGDWQDSALDVVVDAVTAAAKGLRNLQRSN